MQTWAACWPRADLEPIAGLYADDAVFHSHPFREHQPPREYVAWAFADQREARCRFGVPVVGADRRVAVEWWAVLTSSDGSVETIAGVSLLTFDEHGLVVEQRDVWAAEPGTHELSVWAPRPDA